MIFMAKTIFTQQELDSYARGDTAMHFLYREQNIAAAERIAVHADGLYPKKLIEERRPNEPLQVMEYREKIFTEKTKPAFSKVFSSLQKIRRSNEWSIKYKPQSDFPRVLETESLETYCEKKYPGFTSVTNWIFDVVLRQFLIDPNAVALFYPQNFGADVQENEYLKPLCEIFGSHDVIDFKTDDYAVLRNPQGSTYYDGTTALRGGSFYVITVERIMRYDEQRYGNYIKTIDYAHNLNELPAVQLKGIVIQHTAAGPRYESRIAAMLPELDEAVREYSDLQAAKVLHIYPERWEYMQNECRRCKGSGVRPNPAWTTDCNCEREVDCTACNGAGYIAAGPYSKIMVRPNTAMEGGQQVPTPPAGYIDKDTEIVKIQEEGVRSHLYYALAAINYEHLAEVPMAMSGVAKEHDKDEANNWTHSVAEDVVAFMDITYYFIAKYRYRLIYAMEDIMAMLPVIAVPERFDLVSGTQMQTELKTAKEGKFNPIILSALESTYAAVRYANEPEIRERLQLIFKLDPLPNVSDENKMTMLSNNGISKLTYIVSCNINEYIQRAMDADKNFDTLELTAQRNIINAYAQQLIDQTEISVAGIVDDEQEVEQIEADA